MQSLVNTLDNKGPLDYDNFNIITHPPPPRRRQSGVSLVPFRPYVKCLKSVRQPFSYANGKEKWMVMGRDETFFTQPNARCIGSLRSDCHISDMIRWDIEGESTRLPMMCKFWMIVDGAVVERGKPHLVQDAAVQVFTAGRNRRAILGSHQHHAQTSTRTFDRHRRQSWHELNEYHSVSYYQYTRPVRGELQVGIQCDLDSEYFTSQQEILPNAEEHTVQENRIEHFARETIHHLTQPQERAHISITTQTEAPFVEQSTAIDYQFIRMFNLNLETNEILLSSIVNPYFRAVSSNDFADVITVHRHGKEYQHRAISTGDDYPHWWLRLTTDLILADFITNQGEEKERGQSLPPPSPRQDRSIQTDVDKSRTSSGQSSRIQKSSSSATTINHYEFIDDGNNAQRMLPFTDQHHQRVNSRLSDYQIENSSVRSYGNLVKQTTSSSKQSEADYNLFVSSLNQQKQQSSTPDSHSNRLGRHYSSADTTQVRTKSSESASTSVLASLLERYERSLRERQRAFTIVNDEIWDVDNVLKHYRNKMQHSNTTIEHYRNMSFRSKEDQSLSTITNVTRDKYRTMPEITPREMIQAYIPSPRVYLTSSTIVSPRERTPHYVIPVRDVIRPDYCHLCLTDYNASSAWIQYNERRIEQLQRRIDLMLQIDDNEEAELLLSAPIYSTTTTTVSQRIDDILQKKSQYRSSLVYQHDRILTPRRNQYRLPYRLNQSVPTTPRQLSRSETRSTTPVSKSVRISTRSVPPSTTRARQTSSSASSRPIVSILRRSSVPASSRKLPLNDSPHVWRSKADGKLYSLQPFSIPRYYRLYNDVSFRDMYNFSRILDAYMAPDRMTSSRDYSALLTNFALEQQLLSPITSAA